MSQTGEGKGITSASWPQNTYGSQAVLTRRSLRRERNVWRAGDAPGASYLFNLADPMAHREVAERHLKTSEESGAIPLYNDEQPMGGMAAEEMEKDLIEGVDEDGNKVLLEVVRYFFYNGEEYVVLGDAQPESGCDAGCEHCDHHHGDEEDEEAISLYIMKVVESEDDGEEVEEFVPVEDEDLLEKLIEIVQADFDAEESLDD